MAMIARIAALAVAGAVVACGGPDQDAVDTAADPGRGGAMAEMPGMDHGAGVQGGGMGAMMSEGMMEQMRSHMEQMQGAGNGFNRQETPRPQATAAQPHNKGVEPEDYIEFEEVK